MDPTVCKHKFDREVEHISTLAAGFTVLADWKVIEAVYPVLAIVFTHPRTFRCVGFHFQCDGWDGIPPSLTLFDPETQEELLWGKWPQNGWPAGQTHPDTGKPFLCLPGLREYHAHPSHQNDPWDNLKGKASYSLLYLVHRVQHRFGDSHG
jgi:hypothetical protein